MTTISTVGTFEEPCQHQFRLTCELRAGNTPAQETALARLSEFRCESCGALLWPLGQHGKPTAGVTVPLTTEQPETPAPADKVKQNGDASKGLPGTAMIELASELGVESPPGCGCKGAAATMDRLGVAECRNRITDLRLSVAAGWESWGWKDKLRTVTAVAWKAAGLGVKPTDPVRDLLEIAIDRAEAEMTEKGE